MLIAITILSLAPSPPADTLRLSLADAVERALTANHDLRAAVAGADAARAAALVPTQAFLPSIGIGLGGIRTTDPVAVFGLKLRQENFQMADLALDPLNRPDAYGGFSTSATVQLPVFAPEGLFGYTAAKRAADAERAAVRRMQGATVYRVTEAYWSAQLAAHQVRALDTALVAARAHVGRAETLNAQGLVTGLDARLARVRAAEIEAQRLGAAAQAANARHRLATLIGVPEGIELALSDSLGIPAGAVCADDATACDLDERADIDAADLAAGAAAAGVRSAWGKNLPSLALFASLSHYGQDTPAPWGEGSGDWTVGFMVSWNPFAALSGVGAVREARARASAARERSASVRQQAALEVASARRLADAARARVAVAVTAVVEADAALEQADLRYAQGLSPVTELLDVQSSRTAANLNLLAARHDLFLSLAALDFAYGAYDR